MLKASLLGGHIKPDCCRGFDEYSDYHGEQIALQQCHLEAANLEATIEFIREKGLEEEVDLVTCDTVDTYMSDGAWEWGFKSYENFKNAGGNVSKIKVHRGDEAKKVQYSQSFNAPSLSVLSSSKPLCGRQRLKNIMLASSHKLWGIVTRNCGNVPTHPRTVKADLVSI
jgi:hypothetical protein